MARILKQFVFFLVYFQGHAAGSGPLTSDDVMTNTSNRINLLNIIRFIPDLVHFSDKYFKISISK